MSRAGEVGRLQQEFTRRGVKVLALSSNDVSSHKGCVCHLIACSGLRLHGLSKHAPYMALYGPADLAWAGLLLRSDKLSMPCCISVQTCVRFRWISDIEAYTPSSKVDYPIISDPNKDIATLCVFGH